MLQDYRPNFLLPSTWYSFVFPGDSWSILYQFVTAEEAWATVKAGEIDAGSLIKAYLSSAVLDEQNNWIKMYLITAQRITCVYISVKASTLE